ncbi:MAG: hypothetical protein HY810_08735 [Candidatus Omnitrophica bacterium]|nr:hypothetical protein [Candidatus Omnitrophota bacterium]
MVPVAERDSAGVTLSAYTKIPQAPGGIGGLVSSTDGTNTVYYHCLHLGNVNQITDQTGSVIQTYDYDAFGNIVLQSGMLSDVYRYKTKEYSADTGLIYFGARYYNPLLGRFITPDPLGMVDGTNLYLYCQNDPVNLIDAWGECWTDMWRTLDRIADILIIADIVAGGPTGEGIGPATGIKLAGKNKIVIGETMERVISKAKKIGADYYKARKPVDPNNIGRALKNNYQWLRRNVVEQGKKVVDIGIDVGRKSRSIFYEAERRWLTLWEK